MLSLSPLDRYLLFGVRQIDGWLTLYSAEFIAAIADLQRAAGYRGAVGEIGVHHGKLLVLLQLATDHDERAFAIDVFEDQALNVDHSGRGDRAVLQDNLARWCGSTAGVVVIAKSSLSTSPAEILSACGKVRLASIDGGHTAECAYSDLMLMEAVLHDYGVVALDDYFNNEWPDVSTGTSRYMFDSNTRLRPFAVTSSKLFLSTVEFNGFYRAKLANETDFRPAKTSEMFGVPVDVYHEPRLAPPIGEYIRQVLRSSAVGPYLLVAKGTLNRLFRRS